MSLLTRIVRATALIGFCQSALLIQRPLEVSPELTEAIRLDPKNALAFGARGEAYRRKGDNDRAIADFNEATALDPRSASSFVNRGITLL